MHRPTIARPPRAALLVPIVGLAALAAVEVARGANDLAAAVAIGALLVALVRALLLAADLRAARDALEAERRRLAVTVESLDDALLVVDGHGVVAEANPRAAELVPEARVGVPIADVAGVPDPVDALAGEVLVERDGRHLAITAARLGLAGEGLVWTVRDVSERARLERLKSEFVATASHELRSPLTSIKGFAELLHASPGLNDRQREFTAIMLTSTDRLVHLVNDLLDVARVEAGRLTVRVGPTDVASVVAEVTGLLGARLVERDQDVSLDLPADLPPALADPERLRQVLTNLLTNAHLYTPVGGTVRIAARAEPGGVALEVSDTGRGMSEEELEHAFDRFWRAPGAREPGTGLGLALVRALVELMDGTIAVRSAPGRGTAFTVRLPAGEGGEDRRDALRDRRVLVVDADAEAAGLLAGHLANLGATAELRHDGPGALAALREGGFDAMTLDILMPDRAGFELLRAVREDARLRTLPVVIVSVFSGREALAGERALPKPVDPAALADALGTEVLAGRVRVLAVARKDARERVRDALGALGIEHAWAAGAQEAGAACARHRYEVALLDAGLPDPEAVLDALDLRGRRLRPTVVVFADGERPSFVPLDGEPLPLERAGAAVLAALEGGPAGAPPHGD